MLRSKNSLISLALSCSVILCIAISLFASKFIKPTRFELIEGITVDAGLNRDFIFPDPANGKIINIIDFGATALDPSDNDTLAIQEAINSAKKGDIVYIPAGIYHLKTQLKLTSGVSIRGESENLSILDAHLESYTQLIRVSSGANNFTLSHFKIIRTGGERMKAGIEIGSKSGSNCYSITIQNVIVENFEKRGINIRSANHIYVSDCIFRYASNEGGGGHGYGIALNHENNHNNWIRKCVAGPDVRHGYLIQYSAHHNLIEHCLAFDNSYDCYDLHGELEYSNELRYNVARDSARAGFGMGNTSHINSGPFNWIHDNEVYNCQEGATIILDSHEQVISNNLFRDCSHYGVQIHTDGGDDIQVLANVIDNCNVGIYSDAGKGLLIEGNRLESNKLGIKITESVTKYRIQNNDIRSNCTATELGSTDGVYSNNLE